MKLNINEIFFRMPIAELVRYAIVGLTLNVIAYLVYLLVTFLGVSPLVTVMVFYPLGVLASYLAHGRHTFRQKKSDLQGATLVRFVVAHIAGFLINVCLLEVLYKNMGYPHQIIQIVAVFTVAGFLFVTMKLFVFRKTAQISTAS